MTSQPSELGWQPDIPISGSHSLPPDPHFADSIGRNHRLETALADVVDNSIAAGSTAILIRFVVRKHRVSSLYVVDDGRGISEAQIDRAMRFGGARKYAKFDLGYFGLGLKAASFSQAESLTVISHAKGSQPVGRRWLQTKASKSFTIDVVDPAFCEHELSRQWAFASRRVRTIVRWDRIRNVPSGSSPEVAQRFIHDAVTRLQHHFGLVFHRIITDSGVEFGIEVQDARSGNTGPLMGVQPLDPFDYPRSGLTGYPKDLEATIRGTTLRAVCHVWPGRSQLPEFRLPGSQPERYQGLYFYRRKRLIQVGGWNGLEVARKDLQLARVQIDMHDKLVDSEIFRMNPEKTRVETDRLFSAAMHSARAADGTTLEMFVKAAAEAFRQSNKRRRQRAAISPLGRGVPPKLRDAFEDELRSIPGLNAVDLRWADISDDTFFEIDRPNSTIWLNKIYRKQAGEKALFNDAPLLKALLFLLVENLFHGSHLGPKDRDNLELWQVLLTAAAREETG